MRQGPFMLSDLPAGHLYTLPLGPTVQVCVQDIQFLHSNCWLEHVPDRYIGRPKTWNLSRCTQSAVSGPSYTCQFACHFRQGQGQMFSKLQPVQCQSNCKLPALAAAIKFLCVRQGM